MASVWKRLQRVNKRAAKFQYTASYHRIDLETTPKWTPHKLSVVWTRRSRRVATEPVDWEPSLKDPLKGSVIFPVPENHSVAVTLFKDSRTNELEDKDWTFVLEDVSPGGKRRRLAACAVNMRKYASLAPSQRSLTVNLLPCGRKLRAASLSLTLHSVLLREGRATDEDMQSLASLLSVNNNSDIAVLEDLDEDDYTLSDSSAKQMLDFRQQMEEMTQSLTGSDVAATPCSVQSLALDQTPTAARPGLAETPGQERPAHRPDYLASLTKMAKASSNFNSSNPVPYTSTPIKSTDNAEETQDNATPKPIVFKPTPLTKYNLKPLDLKINLNCIGLDRNVNGKDSLEDKDKTPVNELDSLFPEKFDRDKTPVQELLSWCRAVTADYRQCRVIDLSTSFRSGLPLCAIIHHFRPELIDFSGLQPEDHLANARAALEASEKLGVSPVISAADIAAPHPDKLAIMTYLFQLRAHFTGSELQVEQLGNDETESSYLVGRHDTDAALPRDLFNCEVTARRSTRRAPPGWQHPTEPSVQEPAGGKPTSPPATPHTPHTPALKETLLQHSKTILGKVLSPSSPLERQASAKWFTDPLHVTEISEAEPPARPEKLMTRKELTDPFGSDEEDDPQPATGVAANDSGVGVTVIDANCTESTNGLANGEREHESPSQLRSPLASPAELPRPTPQLLSRHDELKERARQLLEATKREAREKERHRLQKVKESEEASREANGGLTNGDTSPSKKPMTEEERQAMLRERARKLIADARAGIVSPTSAVSPSRARPVPAAGVVEIISKQSVLDEIAAAGGAEQLEAMLRDSQSPALRSPRSRIGEHSPSPDRQTPERHTPDRHMSEWHTADRHTPDRHTPEKQPLQLRSFADFVDRLTPENEKDESTDQETGSYIASELAALEKEQSAIDARAAALEKQLRRVMEQDSSEDESRLMSQWFELVNKKNALIRRQMQLNILEQEEDLTRRCELLGRELQLSHAVEEWRKTPAQKRRELLLLQELVSTVNERDRLVQEMDEQEKAIANDDKIQRELSTVDLQRKNNCLLQ